jgi:hypothetical protein
MFWVYGCSPLQRVERVRCIVICGVSGSANSFPHFLLNGTNFGKKAAENKLSCVNFPINLCLKQFSFWEDMSNITYTCVGFYVNWPLIWSDLNETWIFLIYIYFFFEKYSNVKGGPGSSVGIATELRAGRSGIESRWGRDFPPVQTGHGAHPASCKMGTGSFPVVKCGRGVLLTTNPLLVPRSWKSRAIPLPTLWVTPGL